MSAQDATSIGRDAEAAMKGGLFCAESVVTAIARAEGIESDLLPRVATALCSGMGRTCGPCGALTGGVLAIGLALGRSAPEQPVQPAYDAVQRFVRDFEREFGTRDCAALLDGCDLNTPEGQAMFKERQFGRRCLRFTGRAAELAAQAIAERRAATPTAA